MGAVIAKLWRRKKSTKDVLTKIREDLEGIEEFKQSTQAWHKKLIGYLLAYFSVIYLIAALIAYFKYFTNPVWREFSPFASQLRLLAPFIVAPFIFIFLKRFLTWWYHRKLRRNEIAMEKLKKQKAKILDEVMETETYKVAKELLDEFATDADKRQLNLIKSPVMNTTVRSKSMLDATKTVGPTAANLDNTKNLDTATTQQPMVLRQRQVNPGIPSSQSSPSRSQSVQGPSSFMQDSAKNPNNSTPKRSANSTVPTSRTPLMNRPPPGPPLPRPVLPRERGYMDRVVEYLVGDGPHNRYALICKQCQSHNGMALREEFEFIAYRCCYCHYWNPARKQKPTAPRLEPSALRPQISTESSSEDEESESRAKESESASETKETSKDIEKPVEKPAEKPAKETEETVRKNSSETSTSEDEKEKEDTD